MVAIKNEVFHILNPALINDFSRLMQVFVSGVHLICCNCDLMIIEGTKEAKNLFLIFPYVECSNICDYVTLLQVANLKKESEFHWYKEDTEIIPDVKPDLGSGVCKLPIKLVIAL